MYIFSKYIFFYILFYFPIASTVCRRNLLSGKSLPILCGTPISLEMEINYPYLHGWPQKCKSSSMWAYRKAGPRTLFCLFSYNVTIMFHDILVFDQCLGSGCISEVNVRNFRRDVSDTKGIWCRDVLALFGILKITDKPPGKVSQWWLICQKKFSSSA